VGAGSTYLAARTRLVRDLPGVMEKLVVDQGLLEIAETVEGKLAAASL